MSNRLIQGIVDPGKSLFFFLVFGTFSLTLASDALSDLVLNKFGQYLETHWKINPVMFRLIVFAVITSVIILAIALSNLSQWIISRPSGVQPKPLKATFPGLIVIASIAPPGVKSAAQVAIEHHWNEGKGNLQHCWIICGGSKSLEHARSIVNQMQGQVELVNNNPIEFKLTDPHNSQRQLRISLRNLEPAKTDDPNETFKLVNQIYEEAATEGIEASALIADYTGGTKSMTAGIVLACANPERCLEFMKPGGYTEDGRADASKASIATEVQINFQLKAAKPPR
jgi:hypothetical protein